MDEERHEDARPDEGPRAPTGAAPPGGGIVVASQVYPQRLTLLPLPNRPMFPKMVMTLALETPALVEAVRHAVEKQGSLVGLVLRRSREDSEGRPGVAAVPAQATPGVEVLEPELHRIGVIGQVLKFQKPEAGPPSVLIGALDRLEVVRLLGREPTLVAEVSYLYEERVALDDELKAYALAVINSIKDLILLNPLFKEELDVLVSQGSFEQPGRLADYAAFLTSARGEQLQDVLETLDIRERLKKTLELLRHELDVARLQTKLRQEIEERVSAQQREFLLRQQLKAIKKELGLEKDDKEAEIQRFMDRLKERLPPHEALDRIEEEVDKLKALEPASPEYAVTRNYLDWLTITPWGVVSKSEVTLPAARKVLDEQHYGLSDVKQRIVEFIAAGLLRGGEFGGSIICLVGPPGVGKTSIGRSIAKALGREFYRFSLGGMRDEAEIKGHRRTYIGAMPGKFIQALRVCKTSNPVMMLDEIDKVGASFRGDPAAALLEALDPEQNKDFLDHYLDVRFDLSKVLFVCTANQLDTIPPPLLDRMEVIHLSGYILEEKLEIARRFLVPRELGELRLAKDRIAITTAALREIIDGYAREAGVRGLEQHIKKIVRKCAVKLLENGATTLRIGPRDVSSLLGKRIFTDESALKRGQPGVVMGLAWTSLGGDTLLVEAMPVKGNPGFKQTGQLGKVMVESSEIAYTLVRSLCARDDDPAVRRFFDENFVHLHVPAGATPKDGPSAGVTMAVALYSLAHRRPPKPGVAMTGELELSGRVRAVGGIKEKVVAAKRAKVKIVILPKKNQHDFEELSPAVRRGIRAYYVETFQQALEVALGAAPQRKRREVVAESNGQSRAASARGLTRRSST